MPHLVRCGIRAEEPETDVIGLPVSSASTSTSAATSVAASTSTASTAEIAARAFLHRARLVHCERASAEVLTVHHFDRLLCFLVGRHFDEAETLRAAAHLVHDDDGRLDSSCLREGVFEFSVSRAVRQPTDV